MYHALVRRQSAIRPAGPLRPLLSVVAAGLAAFATFSALAAGPTDGSLSLEVRSVPLHPADPVCQAIGPLRYLGGLWLHADDPRFGGLSDLRVSPDGERMVAVSDCGSGLTARLLHDEAGRLVGLTEARLVGLTSPSGGPLGPDEIDAESLVVIPGGELEVGFEGRGRVQLYGPGFEGPARPLGVPTALAECGHNGGLELMADAGAGRRLLVCEARRGASQSVPAWVGQGESWQERVYPLTFDGGWGAEPFRPTAAARLPGGDLLIVERRFPPLGARILRLDRGALDGQGELRPRELARLEPPLTLDNFEGVEVRQDARGRTLVYVLSDDNNCAKRPGALARGAQRTLLLLFELAG
jgi:hypothetical protein